MSKRLQVLLPDDEYRALAKAAGRVGKPVSEFVRESLRRSVVGQPGEDPDEWVAAVLRFARFSEPVGDIEEVLEEIERGRDLG